MNEGLVHTFRAMGGPARMRATGVDAVAANNAFSAAEAEINRLELTYSRYLPNSLVSQLNRSAGLDESVSLSEEAARLFSYADTLWHQSAGLFDITSGALRQVWDFRDPRFPDPAAIERQCELVGWQKINWDGAHLKIPVPGMEIDLGGIVKEYAADAAANILHQHGLHNAMVDLAGDIAVTGPDADDRPWLVGISDPEHPTQALATIGLEQGGLASSGDYQRGFELDGVRYSHLLNPLTGWPVMGLRAVSVLAPQCLVAGSTATIAMLKDSEDALVWLGELGLTWFAVDRNGDCHGTVFQATTRDATSAKLRP